MADSDERCVRGQKPEVDATFLYRAPDDFIANAVRLEVQPCSRVDRQWVSTKYWEHAQPVGIEGAAARADSNRETRILVESPVDLDDPLRHERSVGETVQHRAP